MLDLFDRAVYRANPRPNLDGSVKHVFSYCETRGVDPQGIATFVRKTIDPADPGRIGANRDALDFDLFYRTGENLTGNGLGNDWRVIDSRSVDVVDDGLHNGSAGVKFAASHDEFGPRSSRTSPTPIPLCCPATRWSITTRMNSDRAATSPRTAGATPWRTLRDEDHSARRGAQHPRSRQLPGALARQGAARLRARGVGGRVLSNRNDRGFDARTIKVSFAPGTPLIELTGNASNPSIDPHDEIPELVVVSAQGTLNVRFPRNTNSDGGFHGSGYLIYGLATPQAAAGLELTGVDHVEPGDIPTNDTNGTTRLADLHVIKGNTFQVRLRTNEVKLLGTVRDPAADGDNALVRIDAGLDLNGNGAVDFRTPGSASYGFESFLDKSRPRIGADGSGEGDGDGDGDGDGEFVQTIDATKLEEGVHFLEIRAFRHRTDGGPPVYSSFKKVIVVDRP